MLKGGVKKGAAALMLLYVHCIRQHLHIMWVSMKRTLSESAFIPWNQCEINLRLGIFMSSFCGMWSSWISLGELLTH